MRGDVSISSVKPGQGEPGSAKGEINGHLFCSSVKRIGVWQPGCSEMLVVCQTCLTPGCLRRVTADVLEREKGTRVVGALLT